ncbi:hypothetical protein FRC16_007305, partial [Serendipita sp. 398]
TLRSAVEIALKAIGYDTVIQTVPEFAEIDVLSDFGSEPSRLVSILLDEDDFVFKKESLLNVILHLGVSKAQRNQKWSSALEILLGNGEVLYASDYLFVGVMIKQLV